MRAEDVKLGMRVMYKEQEYTVAGIRFMEYSSSCVVIALRTDLETPMTLWELVQPSDIIQLTGN